MDGTDSEYLQLIERHLQMRYSKHTKRRVIGQAKHFLGSVGVKPAYARRDVLEYVDRLIGAGHKAQSIKVMMAAIRLFFDACELPWPLTRTDLRLGLPEVDPVTPALSPVEVMAFITGVKGRQTILRPMVAMASLYGLRSDEMARLFALGCNGRSFEIQTAKGGRKRAHIVPGVCAQAMTFPPMETSSRFLHRQFESGMQTFVREPLPREGWHAVRRSVATGLIEAQVPLHVVHRWLGWKTSEEGREIALRYWHPDPVALDHEVFDKHPFLIAWRP